MSSLLYPGRSRCWWKSIRSSSWTGWVISEVDSSRFRVDSLPLIPSEIFGGWPLEYEVDEEVESLGLLSSPLDSSLVKSTTPLGDVEEVTIWRWRTSVSLGIAAKNSVKSKLLCGNWTALWDLIQRWLTNWKRFRWTIWKKDKWRQKS